MAQFLPLPDGTSVTIREGETPQQAWARAQQMYPEAFGVQPEQAKQPEETNMFGRLARGFEQTLSSQQTGLASLVGGNEAAQSGLARQQAIAAKYPGQDDWEAVKKKYEEKGVLPAVGEYVSRIPGAVAEQAPQIGESMAAARLGAGAGPWGALAGAAAPSFTQLYGSFLERQAQEQQEAGKPIDVSRLKAAAYAIPATAVDVAATYIPMGKGIVRAVLGEDVAKLLTRGATKEAEELAAKKLTSESFGKTLGTGLAKGAAYEIPGEVTQQMLERAQAGLPLFDSDALAEYGQTAFSTSMLAPIGGMGRFQEKGAARTMLTEEQQRKDAEQRKQEAETEARRKATPEYMEGFKNDYEALRQQFLDMREKLNKPGKQGTPEEWAAYKDRQEALKEVQDRLKADAPEYNRIKPFMEAKAAQEEQRKEQERIAQLSPEEFAYGTTAGAQIAPAKTEGETAVDWYSAQNTVNKPKVTVPEMRQYANEQINLARDQKIAVTPEDYASYLLRDKSFATDLLAKKPHLPGLNGKENTETYKALKSQYDAHVKQNQEALAQREEQLKAPVLPEDEQKYDEIMDFANESRAQGQEELRHLDENFVNALTTKAPAIEVSDKIKVNPQAARLRGRIEELTQAADQADREYRTARGAKERGAAAEAFDRGRKAIEQLDTLAKSGGDYVKEVIAARRAQNAAFDKMQDITEQLRTEETLGGANKEMAASTEETLANEAARQRAAYITSALQEAALHRRAAGKPALTSDEAIKAASKLYDTFNAWVERAKVKPQQAEYEERIVEPAQMRANKVVRPAKVERVQVKPAVAGISQAERKHFQQRLQDVTRQLFEASETTVQKESPLLRTQFATTEAEKVAEARGEKAKTLGGELRRHSEYTLAKLDKVLARKDLPEGGIYEGVERGQPYVYRVEDMRELLEKARNVIEDGKASRELLDAVDAQIDHIERGRHLEGALVKSRGILSEETVVDVVPGNEGRTRFGVKRKWGDVMKNKNLVPLSDYQQDIKDALAAAAPTALEQKESGQKSLFPETDKEFGYIRMTPKNFANSPKIREAWEALDKARALAKRQAAKQAQTKQQLQATAKTLERLNGEVDRIKNDTKFFWANTAKWTDRDLAKAYVGYPEIGNNAEENALVERYLKSTAKDKAAFSEEEANRADKLFREFRDTKLPTYQKRMKEALDLLAQGERLDDIDNQLLYTMQHANKTIADQAAAQRKELSVLREAIKQIKSIAKTERVSPLTKKIEALNRQVEQARSKYRERVEALYKAAHKRMDDALSEILDPEIKKVNDELVAAKKTLEEEKAELERVKDHVDEVLAQPYNFTQKSEEANSMQRAAYLQFQYEEKKSIIEDLQAKIKEQEDDLQNMMETRFETHDQAAAVMEAINDKRAQDLRDKIITLEEQLATLRGDKITAAEPGGRMELPSLRYPFAAQKYESDLKAAQAELKGVERQQTETKQQVKTQAQQLEDTWKEMFGGMGRKRINGQIERIKSTEEQRLEKLHQAEMDKADRAFEAERQVEIKRLQIASIDEEMGDLLTQLGQYENLPNETATLQGLIDDENTRPKQKKLAQEKLDLINQFTSLEAQREAIEEGRPAKKQRAATVETTAKQASRTPFRTGDQAAKAEFNFQQMSREDQRAANLAAEQARGKKAAAEAAPKQSRAKVRGEWAEDLELGADEYTGDLFATETTSAPQVQLSDVAKEALRDGRILDALDDLAQNGSLPFIRENAAAIRKLVSRTRVVITDDIEVDGKQVPAAYNANENVILMKPDALTESNLIHEGTHAATMRGFEGPEDKLNADQLAAKRELTKMFEDLTADGTLTGEYAANNVKEFASEVQSNAALRDKLDNRSMLRKFFDAVLRFIGVTPKATRTEEAQRLIERLYMQSGKVAAKTAPVGAPTYANDDMRSVGDVADKFVAKNKSTWEQIKAAAGGWLGAETMLVDRFAALEKASKAMKELNGSQMMYYARMYDQRMNFVSQAVEHGAPQIVEKTRKDGQVERVIEAKEGPSIKKAVGILKEANKHVGNGEAVNRIFTMYMSAIRAKEKGFNTLHFGNDLTEADLNKAYNTVVANKDLKDIFDRARNEYNEYNRNMLDLLVHSGAISKNTARALMANNDYIPWYRSRNGVAEMVIGNETPVRIGNLKEQPHLQELVGGDKPILDFLTSSVQNTNMLTDMALRNLATKNAVYEMVDIGAARLVRKAAGPNVVKFFDKGEEKMAVVDGLPGIPGDLIVKGMEGIPTQMPAIVRAMAVPSKLLRKAVTLSPMYMAKQLFRDSLAAPITTGANFTPVIGALKQIGSPNKETLERRGIVGGQMLTGTTEDITKILRDISSDKTHWLQGLAKIEAMGMEADALSRRAQYQSFLDQGLSEMEATLMALESMNFNKRGASPSMHWVNSMIPFFNAQVQGLNVLYKAMFGKMPFNARLKIQEKLLQRGALLAGATFAYAAAMQDDEAYKNATPDQKYGNWFFRIPGMDEPVRIPVPFEVGYIFKALPEAMYNSMVNEHGGEEAVEAFKQILLQTIPGGTSYGVPQGIKPLVEAHLGTSFYTGRDILSEHEKRFLPSEQYRDNTSEIAKIVGGATNTSPIMLEELVRGYTGTMGLAMLQAASLPFTRQGPEQAVKRLSDLPVVGGAFQPNDAGGVINNVYEHMKEAQKVEATYTKMVGEGRTAEANALLQQRGNEMMMAQTADWFTTQMGEITKAERAIRASNMSPEEKRKQLDTMRKMKIQLSNAVREASDKTKLLGPLI